MENGVYAALKTDDGACSVFIDQDNVEMARLNRKIRENWQKREREIAKQEQQRAARMAAADKAYKAEEARKRKLRRVTARLIKQELGLVAAMAVVYGGFYVGVVSIFFAAPVLTGLLAVVCFKAGSFFGRMFRQH